MLTRLPVGREVNKQSWTNSDVQDTSEISWRRRGMTFIRGKVGVCVGNQEYKKVATGNPKLTLNEVPPGSASHQSWRKIKCLLVWKLILHKKRHVSQNRLLFNYFFSIKMAITFRWKLGNWIIYRNSGQIKCLKISEFEIFCCWQDLLPH